MENTNNITDIKQVPLINGNRGLNPCGLANLILAICNGNDIDDVTNMHLQKLIYYVNGYHFIKNKQFLIKPDLISFWKHGPVNQAVYHAFKDYGSDAIEEFIQEEGQNVTIATELKDGVKESIVAVLDALGDKSAIKLRNLSHMKDGAWYTVTDNGNDVKDKALSDLKDLSIFEAEMEEVFCV
ncbi:Panacea domain-containing protein [Candidatus Deianiraea vastatrix]|uniref:Phage-associated protein n=1 Tax=Candidatus Deianiraea vastatrix TaxID=2163644 RepID=A0A5B8XDD1_9RICK|nr:type II toxin-antitoxin system antitoxin SocA domain-containing protein [Candidatus Deianiraea vastatrix]QED22895.1 Putative phage-associated protein [Candidatus Deianiraea vastatrix]